MSKNPAHDIVFLQLTAMRPLSVSKMTRFKQIELPVMLPVFSYGVLKATSIIHNHTTNTKTFQACALARAGRDTRKSQADSCQKTSKTPTKYGENWFFPLSKI